MAKISHRDTEGPEPGSTENEKPEKTPPKVLRFSVFPASVPFVSLWLSLAFGLWLPAVASQTADWPQFRGPHGWGVSADTALPVEMGPRKNVAWKTAVPRGFSSPV